MTFSFLFFLFFSFSKASAETQVLPTHQTDYATNQQVLPTNQTNVTTTNQQVETRTDGELAVIFYFILSFVFCKKIQL